MYLFSVFDYPQTGQDQLQHTMAGRNGREMVDMTDTCSICNVVFEDPRMLKCNHNFCFKCIKRCVAKQHYQTSMLCPICKAFSRFPKGKLDDIPSSELHSKQKWAEGHYDNSQGQKGKFLKMYIFHSTRRLCNYKNHVKMYLVYG